jgi:ABC-type multidrug transport system fused ATPase/permease subunit
MLSVYVIAGYRIMPEVAKVFASISNIIHNQPIVDRLYNEMVVDSKNELQQLPYGQTRFTCEPLSFEKQLLVKDVIFKYNQSENIINQITVEIPRGSVIGFAGTTGAGKTTLIDIMMACCSRRAELSMSMGSGSVPTMPVTGVRSLATCPRRFF